MLCKAVDTDIRIHGGILVAIVVKKKDSLDQLIFKISTSHIDKATRFP